SEGALALRLADGERSLRGHRQHLDLGVARLEHPAHRREEFIDDRLFAPVGPLTLDTFHLHVPDRLVMKGGADLVEIAGAQGFEELEEQALAFVRGFHHDRLLSASRRVEFCECFARDAHRVDAGRYAAVDGDLQQDFADLLARDTIRERTLDVDLELMRSVERADHREVDEAAVATLETGSAPDATPAILRGEFLHGATEVIGTGEGLFHVLLAKHGLAD